MRRLYDTLFGALRNAIGLYLGLPPVPLDNVPEDDSSDEEIVEIDSDRHASPPMIVSDFSSDEENEAMDSSEVANFFFLIIIIFYISIN